MPIESYYGYTYSQVIYLQSEILAVGDITHLSWNFADCWSQTKLIDIGTFPNIWVRQSDLNPPHGVYLASFFGGGGQARLETQNLNFSGKSGTAIKILVYDGQGYWLCQKGLSRGRFVWRPGKSEGAARRLDAHRLSLPVYNGDPEKAVAQPPWKKIS